MGRVKLHLADHGQDFTWFVVEGVHSAAGGIATIIEKLLEQDWDCAGLACEGVLSDLADLVAWYGGDLPTAIDAKMAVNRTRVWKRSGDGHGYHTHVEA